VKQRTQTAEEVSITTGFLSPEPANNTEPLNPFPSPFSLQNQGPLTLSFHLQQSCAPRRLRPTISPLVGGLIAAASNLFISFNQQSHRPTFPSPPAAAQT